MNRSCRFAALALSASLALPSVAQAACTQGNATGKWQAIASVFPVGNARSYWVNCALQVRATGAIVNTACIDPFGNIANLTQGQLLLSDGPSCTFATQFRLGNALVRAALAMPPDKNTAHGLGTSANASFTLDLVKVAAFPRSTHRGTLVDQSANRSGSSRPP
jgi:hypothetical protein